MSRQARRRIWRQRHQRPLGLGFWSSSRRYDLRHPRSTRFGKKRLAAHTTSAKPAGVIRSGNHHARLENVKIRCRALSPAVAKASATTPSPSAPLIMAMRRLISTTSLRARRLRRNWHRRNKRDILGLCAITQFWTAGLINATPVQAAASNSPVTSSNRCNTPSLIAKKAPRSRSVPRRSFS